MQQSFPAIRRGGARWSIALLLFAAPLAALAQSLRFNGNPSTSADRVEIPLDAPARPVDVGADFTIELWLRAPPGSNPVDIACSANNDAWIAGNIAIDRDVFGAGDFGDYGVSLLRGRIAFGVSVGASGATAFSVRPRSCTSRRRSRDVPVRMRSTT